MNRLALVPLVVAAAAHAQPRKLPPQPKLTPDAATVVGDARWFSFHTEDEKTSPDYTLHIVKLSKAGHSIVSSTLIEYDGKETWLDAHTLAVVRVDTEKKTYKIDYFVDGVIDAKRTVAGPLLWKVPKGKEAPTVTWGYRGAKGELYLRTCMGEDEGGSECPKPIWTRIDGAKPGPVGAPKGVVPFSQSHGKAPSVKAPKDITVKLTKIASTLEEKKKIPAITCTKGGATTTWSYESMEGSGETFFPKTTSWVMLDPPIYSATGTHYNPVAWKSTETYFFRACEPREMETFVWHDGLWQGTTYSKAAITLYAGNDPVAVFDGRELLSAPTK
jgi:hypothetical protein